VLPVFDIIKYVLFSFVDHFSLWDWSIMFVFTCSFLVFYLLFYYIFKFFVDFISPGQINSWKLIFSYNNLSKFTTGKFHNYIRYEFGTIFCLYIIKKTLYFCRFKNSFKYLFTLLTSCKNFWLSQKSFTFDCIVLTPCHLIWEFFSIYLWFLNS